ncbi:hypothetical protein [Chloroflexus sp.]|uniref:hypothetical protein n=1 Tax=Chloroflexus sp. TaxID=1904827 RepID=UPI002ADD4DD7|nr:hypothetical protein [Chloroflexus sp.]
MQQLPDLSRILHHIGWALIGAIALRTYAPERLTQDVDIIIHARDEQVARAAFTAADNRIGNSLPISRFTAHPQDETGYSIDVLVLSEP